jgi:hypothetical protein
MIQRSKKDEFHEEALFLPGEAYPWSDLGSIQTPTSGLVA